MRMTLVAMALTAAFAASPGALAGPRDVAIHVTRLGGDAASAQPYVDKFFRYVEGQLGWPAGTMKGAFLVTKKEAQQYIQTSRPGLGIMEPSLYFELRKSQGLTPILQVQGSDLVSAHYNVVAKDPAIKSLADLKGRRVCTTLGDSPQYLSRVVLDGQVDAASAFQLQPIAQALKGIKGVLRGQCDATLLDDDQLAQAKKIAGGGDLRSVYTSPALPPIPVVVFGASLSADEQAKLVKALSSMCAGGPGADICKEMHISRFVPVDAATFAAAQKRYGE